jgi:hypothetical protein
MRESEWYVLIVKRVILTWRRSSLVVGERQSQHQDVEGEERGVGGFLRQRHRPNLYNLGKFVQWLK